MAKVPTFNADPDRPPKGWSPEVWRLRATLLAARERLPYATANARLLDGVERYVRIAGRGKPASGPWWASVLALVKAAVVLLDPESAKLLAPWVGLVRANAVAGSGFEPIKAPDRG